MKKVGILAFGLMFVLFSCKDEVKTALETQSLTDDSYSQSLYDDALKSVEDAMEDNEAKLGRLSELSSIQACSVAVTVDTSYSESITVDGSAKTVTGKITIDFGTTNQTCNLRSRRGKMIVKYTGKYRTVGTAIITTFEDYYVDDNKISGIKTVVNKGPNTDGKTEFKITVENGEILFTDGKKITWKSTRTRTWDVGEQTKGLLGLADDEWVINGSTEGVSRNGTSFTTSLNSLRFKNSCLGSSFYPVSGTRKVTTSTGTRTLDFGAGTCDKNATYTTVDGSVYDIKLQ